MKIWKEAIMLAIKQREDTDPLALRKLANKLLNNCDKGDINALKELGDRLDGKATQQITGQDDKPLIPSTIEIILKNATGAS